MSDYDQDLAGVDTTGAEEMGAGFTVFPEGDYPAILVSMARKQTKDGAGQYLECSYQFIEGDYAGEKFISRLNMWNSNQTAVKIARSEMAALQASLGLSPTEQRKEMYLNKPVVLSLKPRTRKENGELENNLKKITAYQGYTQQQAPALAPGQAPVQQQFAPQQQPQQARPPANHAFAPPANGATKALPWQTARR